MTACEYLFLDSADALCMAAFFIVLRMLSRPLVESPHFFFPSFSEYEDRELELLLCGWQFLLH